MASVIKSVQKFPSVFISHGGGPCFFMDVPQDSIFYPLSKNSKTAEWLKQLVPQLKLHATPKAIVVISAHWEEDEIKVYGHSNPNLYFDYYGFPKETYELKYPAPGSPEVANKVVKALQDAGISCGIELSRGFDHGVFVPFLLAFPEAKIPVIQLSLNSNLDPATHFKIGKALNVLRNEVLIVGSGFMVHDLSRRIKENEAKEFVLGVRSILSSPPTSDRYNKFLDWTKIPFGRKAHPRAEHLIPLYVAAGASTGDSDFVATRLNNLGESQLTNYLLSFDSYRFDEAADLVSGKLEL